MPFAKTITYAEIVGVMMTMCATALPPDDQALLQRALLQRVRPLALETVLVKDGKARARIICPTQDPWHAAAVRIQTAVRQKTGVSLDIVADTEMRESDWTSGNVIVIGNLLVSPAYARLYHNFFVCADAGYTGTEGYELRSVHEPFGPGGNAIALGAQSGAGLERGADRLAALVREHGDRGRLVLPRLLELDLRSAGARAPKPAPLTAKDIEAGKQYQERIYARPGTERAAPDRFTRDAMRYHRTGDEGYFEIYRYGILRHLRYYAESDYVNSGLGRYDREFRDSWTWKLVVTWDLLEEHPGWTDEERLRITNHILRCLLECNVYQGWNTPEKVEYWRNFHGITHNHHTWPGLADLFGGWYFQRHYRHPMATDWLTIAMGMFNGCKHSAKPWEDSAGYQWIPLRHVLTYSYAAGDPAFTAEGHAARAGKVALMCLDSLGHQPAFGDHSSFLGTSWMPYLFSGLEYATRDGCYRWALDRIGARSGGELGEAYYAAALPRRPDELTGVAVSYLPKVHYDLNGLNPQYFPKANIPFAESFDKLTLRTGWKPTDDYLLLDGYSGGTHGHQDGNAIIGYTAAGAHWLVDGEYIRLTPKYHCAVTIVRDGTAGRNPAMARLDDAVWFGDAAICRTTMPAYNGVRWSRRLFWRPNRWLAVVDRLTALEAGEYALRCCWRVYGEPKLTGNRLVLRQGNASCGLWNLSGDSLELNHIKDMDGQAVSQLYQRRFQHLAAGESLAFVNVLAARRGDTSAVTAWLSGPGRLVVADEAGRTAMGCDGLRCGNVTTDAATWMADEHAVRLASAGSCRVAGKEVRLADATGGLRLENGRVILAVARPTPVSGLRPVESTADSERTLESTALVLDRTLLDAAPASPTPARPLRFANIVPTRKILWRHAEFPRELEPARKINVRSTPAPTTRYRPVERLVDGRYQNSTGSSLFPKGAAVTIELDLGTTRHVAAVRLRAWEMSETWRTKNRRLDISADGKTWTRVAGEFVQTGTESWGGNVNTIYALKVGGPVRHLRLGIDPADADCHVYLAEIEVMVYAAETPALTALGTADTSGDGTREVLLGTDGGDVLAFSLDGKQLWERNVGDRVTSFHAAGSGKTARLLAGSESGFVQALDGRGQVLWKTNLGAPVRRLLVLPDGRIVGAASTAGLTVLTPDGAVAAVMAAPASVLDIVLLDDAVAATLADGSLACFPLATRGKR